MGKHYLMGFHSMRIDICIFLYDIVSELKNRTVHVIDWLIDCLLANRLKGDINYFVFYQHVWSK